MKSVSLPNTALQAISGYGSLEISFGYGEGHPHADVLPFVALPVSRFHRQPNDPEWVGHEGITPAKKAADQFPAFQPFVAGKGEQRSVNLAAINISKVVSLPRQTDDFALKTSYFRPAEGQKVLFQAFFVRNSEFIAAPFAATRYYSAPVFGGHSAAKTVFILTLAAGRLIGTFHRLFKKKLYTL